ncbi:hypothetical protein [Moraxella lacunata]|uniref:hypothetical protein n=1 Tax=Moraxella lacunata TaxID=477 RepID=UPI003EDECF52
MTKNPASINLFKKVSDQNSICEPKPVMNSKGGWSGLPPASTHSVMPRPTSTML